MNFKLNIEILFILSFILLLPCQLFSQTNLTLSFSQTMADDWKQGKRQAFEAGHSLKTKQKIKIDTFEICFSINYAYGLILEKSEKTDKHFWMPTDNDLFGEVMLKYPAGWQLDPYFSASFKTQLTESFKLVKEEKKRTAKLWDPVTSQEALGFAFNSKSKISRIGFRFGISLKQIRADKHPSLSDDRKTRDITEKYKAESGIEIKASAVQKIGSTVTYSGGLDLFGTFDALEIWAVELDNELQIKIWKIFGVIVRAKVFYDQNKSLKTQYSQNLSIGIAADLQ